MTQKYMLNLLSCSCSTTAAFRTSHLQSANIELSKIAMKLFLYESIVMIISNYRSTGSLSCPRLCLHLVIILPSFMFSDRSVCNKPSTGAKRQHIATAGSQHRLLHLGYRIDKLLSNTAQLATRLHRNASHERTRSKQCGGSCATAVRHAAATADC